MLRELYEQEVDPYEGEPTQASLADVRRTALALRQVQRAAEQVRQLRTQVQEEYGRELEQLEQREQRLKEVLLGVLQRGPHGSIIRMPDVGKLHVGKSAEHRLRLKRDGGQEEAVSEYGFRFARQETVHDMAAMHAWALEHYKKTGEVPTGYEAVPQAEHLVFGEK